MYRSMLLSLFGALLVVGSGSTATAQSDSDVNAEIAAIKYVRENLVPEGKVVFDPARPVFFFQATRPAGARHADDDAQRIAESIGARIGSRESTVVCTSDQRKCHFVDAKIIISSSPVTRSGKQAEVFIRARVEDHPDQVKGSHSSDISVQLELTNSGWRVAKATTVGVGR